MFKECSNLDKVYGVYKEDGTFMIGETPIYSGEKYIALNNERFPRNPGSTELLLVKHPHEKLIVQEDMDNYRNIL